MRWRNRCPYRIFAIVGGRWQCIDRCYYEADEPHEHWSKQHGFREDWRISPPIHREEESMSEITEPLEKGWLGAVLKNVRDHGNQWSAKPTAPSAPVGSPTLEEIHTKFPDTLIEPEVEPAAWEIFRDLAYYDMWCVRRVGERRFGFGYHVPSEAEAQALRDELECVRSATHTAIGNSEKIGKAV